MQAGRLIPFAAICWCAARAALADAPVQIPIQVSDNFPVLTVKIAGMDVPVVFDSGDQSTLVLQRDVLYQTKAVPTGAATQQRFVKGKVVQSMQYRLPRVQIGDVVFTNVVGREDVHDPDYQPADVGQKGFLGTGLLKSYVVAIDYPRRTMALIPRADTRAMAQCQGTAAPFSPAWHGEPVTEAETDFGRVALWWNTGAPVSVISRSFLQSSRPHVSAGGVTSQRFILGGSNFGPWRFEVWDVSLPSGFNGFVGYDFFSQHVVCLDFPGRRVVIPH
jgi:hypothetical protein